jgi:hypothetical protein
MEKLESSVNDGKFLWEILVPTTMNNPSNPCRIGHHREWDKRVRKISGGLTILEPAKGQWIDAETKTLYEERVIPVRIACSEEEINKIIDMTIQHYRQEAVMAYLVSEKVIIRRKPDVPRPDSKKDSSGDNIKQVTVEVGKQPVSL